MDIVREGDDVPETIDLGRLVRCRFARLTEDQGIEIFLGRGAQKHFDDFPEGSR